MSKLPVQEAAYGWTHEIVITYEDFSTANAGTIADDTAKTFTYAVPAGAVVRNVGVKNVTEWDDSGSGADLDLDIGVTGGDTDGYINAMSIHTDDATATDTYANNSGALLDNENGSLFTAAGSIDMIFTPNVATGASYSLNELTTGEVRIRFDIAQL